MLKWVKRLGWVLAALVLLAGMALFVLQRWVGSDDFRTRVQAQAEAALGVPVRLGGLQVDAWPALAVALERVELQTRAPLTAKRVELRVRLRPLLSGRMEVDSLVVQSADLPQQGIDALLAAIQGKAGGTAPGPASTGTAGEAVPLVLIARRLTLEDVTWRNIRGEATTLDASVLLGPQGLPDTLDLTVRAGVLQGAHGKATRQAVSAAAADPVWDIRVQHAGGSIDGTLTVQDPIRHAPKIALNGQFETRNLELSRLRKGVAGPISGRLQASTTLSAKAESTAALAAALTTQSRFTVQDAVVNGIDLAKAVQTVGMNRGGQTRLDSLAGQVTTRGAAIQLSNLAASSGALSATGDVAVSASRAMTGRVRVNLGAQMVGKAVGVPLEVGGTLDAPSVTLTRSAMLGAAIGTLVMPGVGTGAGASMGDAIGDKLKGLFKK